jgi:hypothetical protein
MKRERCGWRRSSAARRLDSRPEPQIPRSSFGRTEHYSSPTFPLLSSTIIMSVEMAVTPANARPLKRQRASDASSTTTAGLQCQVCHRSYERADHLNRHLDSREYFQGATQPTADLAQTVTNALFAAKNVPPHSIVEICFSDIKPRMQRTLQTVLWVPAGSQNVRQKLATPV